MKTKEDLPTVKFYKLREDFTQSMSSGVKQRTSNQVWLRLRQYLLATAAFYLRAELGAYTPAAAAACQKRIFDVVDLCK